MSDPAYAHPATPVFDDELPPEAEHMTTPVLCHHCRAVYELNGIGADHSHADCDVFTTPCCGRQVDTRRFKSMPDYTRLDRRKPQGPYLAEYAKDDRLYPGGQPAAR